MHALLGLLVAIVLLATIVGSVLLDAGAASCRGRFWIGRGGEQPLATLFALDLDEEVAPTAEGETPLLGLAPGTYDVHFEGDGCWWAFSLVGR